MGDPVSRSDDRSAVLIATLRGHRSERDTLEAPEREDQFHRWWKAVTMRPDPTLSRSGDRTDARSGRTDLDDDRAGVAVLLGSQDRPDVLREE